ncbi:MAG: GGDEF domain-containing protein [Candidatus Izemoplasmatales bacterium]
MKMKERLAKIARNVGDAYRDLRRHGTEFVALATETNFVRFRLMVFLAFPLIAGTMVWVASVDPGNDPGTALWRTWILIIDGVMIVSQFALLGILALCRRAGRKRAMVVLQYLGVGLLIALNAANTAVGQYVSPNITVFIYACVLAGFAFFIRPTAAATIFAVNFVIATVAMGYTQTDPLQLASNRMNLLATVTLGFFFSIVGWLNFMAKTRRTDLIQSQTSALAKLANTDRLSGLLNRGAMEDAIREAYLAQAEDAQPIPIFILDLDEFKLVNDGFGHPAGDHLIRMVAGTLLREVPKPALISRWGGDEFMVACPIRSMAEIRVLAERVRDVIATTGYPFEGVVIHTSVSIGVSRIDATFDKGYRDADKALYLAKRSGKNQVKTVDDLR